MYSFVKRCLAMGALVSGGLLLSGCGGGGSGSGSLNTPTVTITGTVNAGPVDGASLNVVDARGLTVGGPVTVTSGGFSVDVPEDALSGDLIVESSGGTYTDEATGQPGVPSGTLSAFVPGGSLSAGDTIHVSAGSTVIRETIRNGVAASDAADSFRAAFGFDVDASLVVADPTAPVPDATAEELLAGLRNAAFCQLTADMGLEPKHQASLLAALGRDLSDGVLDGDGLGGPVAVNGVLLGDDTQNLYERAIVNFRAGGHDQTGLKPTQIGPFPFGKVAYAGPYRIEYLAGKMGPSEGRTRFTLRVTDGITGAPAVGLGLAAVPWMFMDAHSHTTPVDAVLDNGDGTYTCTAYYLMASTMASGMSMGYWELRVSIGAETAYFYPSVMMAMGDTKKATLKDAGDKIPGAMGQAPTVRNYYLFNDGLTGSPGDHTLYLFVATRQSMMNHPAVSVGTRLMDENSSPWTVDAMTVEISTDGGTAWQPLSDGGGGHWSAVGIQGLASGDSLTLLVRLSVNGVFKTSDGSSEGLPAAFDVTVP